MSKTTIPSGGLASDIALDGDISVTGTTPSITVGDAGAEDAKIVFDGNAQDYHIGLDDSADTLVIGKGSALGTTSHIVIDENGHVTKPLQPAFLAQASGAVTNVATNNAISTLVMGSEYFDLNGDYNTGTYTFTAPVTGKYLFSFSATLNNVDTGATYISIHIRTSNRNYNEGNAFGINGYSADETRVEVSQTILADMDANDTATLGIQQFEGTAQMDVNDDSAYFCGHLVA